MGGAAEVLIPSGDGNVLGSGDDINSVDGDLSSDGSGALTEPNGDYDDYGLGDYSEDYSYHDGSGDEQSPEDEDESKINLNGTTFVIIINDNDNINSVSLATPDKIVSFIEPKNDTSSGDVGDQWSATSGTLASPQPRQRIVANAHLD